MKRYYFDVYNGFDEIDNIGTDFPNDEIAIYQASRIACQHVLRPKSLSESGCAVVVKLHNECRALIQVIRLAYSIEPGITYEASAPSSGHAPSHRASDPPGKRTD